MIVARFVDFLLFFLDFLCSSDQLPYEQTTKDNK